MSIDIKFSCCPICGMFYAVGKDASPTKWHCKHITYVSDFERWDIDLNIEYKKKHESKPIKDIKYSLHDLQKMYARFLVETGAKYENDCIPDLMPKEFIIWMEKLLAGEVK